LDKRYSDMSMVAHCTPIILETIFRRLITGVDNGKEYEELLNMLSIEVREGNYMVLILHTDKENVFIKEVSKNFFEEALISIFERNKDEYVMVLFMEQNYNRQEMLTKCCKLQRQTDGIMAVGQAHKSIYDIGKSYKGALCALDSRNASIREDLVVDADMNYAYTRYELPGNMESVLYHHIISGRGFAAEEKICQSLQENLDRGVSFKEYLQLIHVYEMYLVKWHENLDMDEQKKLKWTIYDGASFCMRDVEKRVGVLLENYRQISEVYEKKATADVMDQILQYVENNMEKDIGLEDVAAAVHLTPNYISKYFKRASGVNFKEWLTMKRMEKAKIMLTESDMTVKDIAAKCGYNSSKQFIINFTKIMEVSPTEYRKRYR